MEQQQQKSTNNNCIEIKQKRAEKTLSFLYRFAPTPADSITQNKKPKEKGSPNQPTRPHQTRE